MAKRYRCLQCGYPVIDDNDLANGVALTNNAATHWRMCIQKRYWPSYMRIGLVGRKVLDKPETVMFTSKSSNEGANPPGSSVPSENDSVGTPSLSLEL